MNDVLKKILKYNETFVNNKGYLKYSASKFPRCKTAIISCMDARLTKLLPAALGLKDGDVKLIKNAGGYINTPYDSVVFSLIVAIYELEVDTILVIGHDDCGVEGLNSHMLIEKIKKKGISFKDLNEEELQKWLSGFDNVEKGVTSTMEIIKTHPLISDEINVYGLVINPETGKLREI